MTQKVTFFIALPVVFLLVFLLVHGVGTAPTADDRAAWDDILAVRGDTVDSMAAGWNSGFDGQVKTVLTLQDTLLRRGAGEKSIPTGMTREPADLLMHVNSSCGDRSRALFKAFRLIGAPVRYVFVRGAERSHAVVEVKTDKGWMLVDSSKRWVGLDADGNVIGRARWLVMDEGARRAVVYKPAVKAAPYELLLEPGIGMVYGLYSVHGEFYPPFTPFVPDIDWGSFVADNLLP